jgi:hypothetical protein
MFTPSGIRHVRSTRFALTSFIDCAMAQSYHKKNVAQNTHKSVSDAPYQIIIECATVTAFSRAESKCNKAAAV